jgi:DhnA family fructose-bisphosphate aldolase class Ia
MMNFRLNRLFNERSGRCFDVALDHGFFNLKDVLAGIEDIRASVRTIVDAAPDAIQLTIGQARHLQSIPGKAKPALVLRTDVANVYGKELPRSLYSRMIEEPVLQAVQLDATCVVVNLFRIPEQPEVAENCVQNILRLKPECERYHMPLMIEPLVFQPNSKAGGYMVDGDPDKIIPLVRQAVEMGADIIKADPTDDTSVYHKVIETAGDVPVLVRGGGKVPDREILIRTHELIEQGAAGIVYGRNIIQNENPAGMTRALMAILHDGVSPDQAAELLNAR